MYDHRTVGQRPVVPVSLPAGRQPMLFAMDVPVFRDESSDAAITCQLLHLEALKMDDIMTQTHQGTALITGASSGIGAVYADRLARRGYDLILVARNRDRLIGLADRITNETHRSVEIVDADLNDRAALASVKAKPKQDASITLLVNNAGVGTHQPLLDSNVDAMTRMIGLNVTALTRLTYAAIPGFVARGNGAVIKHLIHRRDLAGDAQWCLRRHDKPRISSLSRRSSSMIRFPSDKG